MSRKNQINYIKFNQIQSFHQDSNYPLFNNKPLNILKIQNEIIDDVMEKDTKERKQKFKCQK